MNTDKFFDFLLSNKFFRILCIIVLLLMVIFTLCCSFMEEEIGCNYDYYIKHNEKFLQPEECYQWTRKYVTWVDMGDEVQTPDETYNNRRGDCKSQSLMTAYWLYTMFDIDSQLINCKKSTGGGHVILYVEGHYYESYNEHTIDSLIGEKYFIVDSLDYCQAIWEAQTCHCFYTIE